MTARLRSKDQASPSPLAWCPRAGSKQALLISLLMAAEGASLDTIVAATGWLPHTVRAALTGLRKRGYAIARLQESGGKSSILSHCHACAASCGVTRMPMQTHPMARPASRRSAPDCTAFEIESLNALDPDLLHRRWRALMGRAAPAHLSRSLMVRILAYRQQAQTHGDLDRATLRVLDAAIGQGEPASGSSPIAASLGPQPDLRPGTVLTREYGGVLHRVMVGEQGFVWNGQTYVSLSKVARAITGTRWNGPRFFGLRQTAKGSDGKPEVRQQEHAACRRPEGTRRGSEAAP